MIPGAGDHHHLVERKNDKEEESRQQIKRLELGRVPDDEIRRLIRVELDKRLRLGHSRTYEQQTADVVAFTRSLRKMSIAKEVDTLDAKMYETPISFIKLMHGNTIKESCCYFKDDSITLDEAEIAMLDLYCERSQIKDDHRVLDMGCGHGALTMHVARKYKNCHVTGITYSISQKEYIEEQCKINKLKNVDIKLADIATHEMEDRYDRIIAIGLIEHMKNYELLLRKVSKWMTPDGLLFIDYLCHKTFAYNFEPLDEDGSFLEYFFEAGTITILSANLLLYFQELWLKNIDDNAEAVKEIMVSHSAGSVEAAAKQFNYWRGLNLQGIELFGYGNGEEWMTSQVLFKKK